MKLNMNDLTSALENYEARLGFLDNQRPAMFCARYWSAPNHDFISPRLIARDSQVTRRPKREA